MGTLKAVKGNREYTVDEVSAKSYVKEGFDIYDGGKKIKSGKGKSVPQDEYDKLKEELEEMKKAACAIPENELLPILKEYAQLKQVNIGNAATVKGIYGKIKTSGGD